MAAPPRQPSELPVVSASRADLERTISPPFRALADMPAAMTAHVVFKAIDADGRPAPRARVIAD